MWLIRLSINRPVFTTMIECLLIVMGIFGFIKIGVDIFPKIEPPVITVTTIYSGAGPEEIESLISKPIEEQINQLGGIERLSSYSRQGVSQVVAEFKLEVSGKEAQIDVRDRLSRIRSKLPKEIEEPVVIRADFADRPILQMALLMANRSAVSSTEEAKLRFFADEIIKPRIQQVDGVGQINVFGGLEREVNLELDLNKLNVWKVTPFTISKAIQEANANIPGGEILEEPIRRSLRVLGQYQNVAEMKETIVKHLSGGKVLRVSDFGEVRDTFKESTSLARVNGKSAVLLEIKKQSDANTVKVVDAIQEKMPDIKSVVPADYDLVTSFDGTKMIRASLVDVIETIAIAALLAVLVVYLFLGSMQSTFITGLALPCTIITSFFALYAFGFTLNMMTLLGMSLSVGLILDDAIVVRENIWTKIEEGMDPKTAAMKGSEQVFVAVLATSLTILATFFPVTLIPGVVGKFLGAFALTVCVAVVISTFDAIMIAPMLSAYMVTHGKDHTKKQNHVIERLENMGTKISNTYAKILATCIKNPGKVLIGSVLIFFSSFVMMRWIGFSFLPPNENGEFDVQVEAPIGTSLNKTNEIVQRLEAKLKEYPEINLVASRVGTDLNEPNIALIYVQLVPLSKRSFTSSEMKSEINRIVTPLVAKENCTVSVRDTGGGGGGRALNAVVQGLDYKKLEEISAKITKKTQDSVPEIVNLETSMKPGRPEIQISIHRQRAAEFALKPNDIGQSIRGYFEGEVAGQYRDSGNEYDIRLRLRPQDRYDSSVMSQILLPNLRDELVPLNAVTEFKSGYSPTKIVRLDQVRAVQFQGDLADNASLGAAIGKFRNIIMQDLPQGFQFKMLGQANSMKDLQIGAMIALGLGMLLIYMVMASLYESFILPFSILLPLPLAMVGALGALLLSGKFLDIYSVIGIIMLMGLVTKNAILVIDYVEELRREGLDRTTALMQAGVRRLRPIMMTSAAMIAGMIPVAMGYNEINKIRSGMGMATIGGLTSSTILSLVVVPCAYIYLDRMREWFKSKSRKMSGEQHSQTPSSPHSENA